MFLCILSLEVQGLFFLDQLSLYLMYEKTNITGNIENQQKEDPLSDNIIQTSDNNNHQFF